MLKKLPPTVYTQSSLSLNYKVRCLVSRSIHPRQNIPRLIAVRILLQFSNNTCDLDGEKSLIIGYRSSIIGQTNFERLDTCKQIENYPIVVGELFPYVLGLPYVLGFFETTLVIPNFSTLHFRNLRRFADRTIFRIFSRSKDFQY